MFRTLILHALILAIVWPPPAPAQSSAPSPVSPGGATAVLPIAQSCPTFSWGGSGNTLRYALMIFKTSELGEGEGEPEPVLEVTLPGSVRSWTPSLDLCFESGIPYGWYVMGYDEDGEGQLSEGRFFKVKEATQEEVVAAAIDVLERYLARSSFQARALPVSIKDVRGVSGKDRKMPAATRSSSASVSPRPDDLGASLASEELPLPSKTIGSGTAGLRAEIPDTGGVTFGVVGISHSGEGAGLAGENTDGGPDLLLGGPSFNLEMTEAGIDLPSDAPQSFDIGNSGSGTMSLTVDGAKVLNVGNDGSGSGFDADFLDGRDGSSYLILNQQQTVSGRPRFSSSPPFTVNTTSRVNNLNADQLDGVHATSLLRSDASDSFTSGTLTFSSGTRVGLPRSSNEQAPGIFFSGDPDTGIYTPTLNQLAIAVGGNTSLRLPASGHLFLRGSLFLNGLLNENLTFDANQSRFELTDELAVSGPLLTGSQSVAPVSYNRMGGGASNRALSGASDLLVSQDLEVNGTVFADGGIDLGGAGVVYGCGTYVPANFCPPGNEDGPRCDRVPAGSFCESDGECARPELNNCGSFDWWFKVGE